MVKRWTTLRDKKCISLGNSSRGFLIKTCEMRLKSSKRYVLKIIPEEEFYAVPKSELVGVKIQKVNRR